MILVEADTSEEWDSSSIDWPSLAARAVAAGVAHSRFAALGDSPLAVEVSVKFAADDEVKALNAGYRARDKPTNVLSFPMIDPELIEPLAMADTGEVLLGDIVLAHGVCAREAEAKAIPIEDHAAHLIVHGALHLLGYEHETSDHDADAMEAAERRALAAIGISDPYADAEVRSEFDARR